MNDDARAYETTQKRLEAWYESLCRRCGKCCGAGEVDPCANLHEAEDGTFVCAVYETRLGKQKTVSGREFNCVLVREVLQHDGALLDCAYRKP
jgi:uncharacterized cysteine cluster protein YcgN (CxxCxxCC family)